MSRHALRSAAGAALLLLALPLAAGAQHATFDSTLWSGMHYRMIGPERGGRVTAVTGVASQPRTFYMGSTGGGVWKTTDAGAHVDQRLRRPDSPWGRWARSKSRSRIRTSIYAGTGSSKIRSNVSIGRGIYKSTDAGRTLDASSGCATVGQISTVRVRPHESRHRVRRRARQSLRRPTRPRRLQDHRRRQDVEEGAVRLRQHRRRRRRVPARRSQRRCSPACGTDSASRGRSSAARARAASTRAPTAARTGPSWAADCPTSSSGAATWRSPAAMPNRIYALIEAKPGGGLYRSEDAGATWTLINGAAEPDHAAVLLHHARRRSEQRRTCVYVGNEGWFKSTDGGKTFRTDARAARRPPRHLDQPAQLADHDPVQRRRRQRLARRRADLEHAAQPAHRRDLSGGGGQSVSLSRLRRAAGQHHGHRAEPAARQRAGVAQRSGLRDRTDHSRLASPEIVYGECKGQFSRLESEDGQRSSSTGSARHRSTATAAAT